MKAKNLDIVACNDVLAANSGFASDTNTITVISKDGSETQMSGTKDDVADSLLDAVMKEKNKG